MSQKFMLFRVSEKFFALKLILIKEVILQKEIESIPKTQDNIKGIINLRGQVIPIINFSKILQIDAPESEKPNLIVLDAKDEKDFGFEVDEVLEVLRIEESLFDHKIDSDKKKSQFTYSVVSSHPDHKDKLIYVIKDEFCRDKMEKGHEEVA